MADQRHYQINLQRLLRKERRLQRLGFPNPKCAIPWCPEGDFLKLVPLSKLSPVLQQKLIEGHHVGGRKAGNWKVPLCKNHHMKASDRQYDWDEQLRFPATEQERTAAYAQGQAEILRLEAQERLAAADMLEEVEQGMLTAGSKSSVNTWQNCVLPQQFAATQNPSPRPRKGRSAGRSPQAGEAGR